MQGKKDYQEKLFIRFQLSDYVHPSWRKYEERGQRVKATCGYFSTSMLFCPPSWRKYDGQGQRVKATCA